MITPVDLSPRPTLGLRFGEVASSTNRRHPAGDRREVVLPTASRRKGGAM